MPPLWLNQLDTVARRLNSTKYGCCYLLYLNVLPRSKNYPVPPGPGLAPKTRQDSPKGLKGTPHQARNGKRNRCCLHRRKRWRLGSVFELVFELGLELHPTECWAFSTGPGPEGQGGISIKNLSFYYCPEGLKTGPEGHF